MTVLSTNHSTVSRFSPSQRSLLFSMVAVGTLVAVYPVILLINYRGPKTVFAIFGAISAISTVLIPLAASIGFPALLLVRALQVAACPLMGAVASSWSALSQSGLFISILTSHFQFAPLFTMPVAGALCSSSYGWPAVYYVHAVVGFLLFAALALFYTDEPQLHRNVSKKELDFIRFGKTSTVDEQRRQPSVPYIAILRSPSIWGIFVAAVGGYYGMMLAMQYSPSYLNKVLGFPVASTGLASAAPYIVSFGLKLVAGMISDSMHCISERRRLQLFSCIAFGGMTALFLCLANIPPRQAGLAAFALAAGTTFLAFTAVSLFKSASLVARQHNHFVMGVLSFIYCVVVLIMPFVIEFLAPNNAAGGWAWVLYTCCGLLLICNAVFCYLCSADAAEWTHSNHGSAMIAPIVPIPKALVA